MLQPGWEGNLGEDGYMYIYCWVPWLFTWNCHNVVNQLYFNIKLKVCRKWRVEGGILSKSKHSWRARRQSRNHLREFRRQNRGGDERVSVRWLKWYLVSNLWQSLTTFHQNPHEGTEHLTAKKQDLPSHRHCTVPCRPTAQIPCQWEP